MKLTRRGRREYFGGGEGDERVLVEGRQKRTSVALDQSVHHAEKCISITDFSSTIILQYMTCLG